MSTKDPQNDESTPNDEAEEMETTNSITILKRKKILMQFTSLLLLASVD